jgi:predicted metal-binding membrane protein
VEAAWPSPGSASARIDPARLVLLAALLALAVVAWLVTDDRMGGMQAMPGMDLGTAGFFAGVWFAMMAAMMLPAVAPTVLTYDRLRAGQRTDGTATTIDATALFVAGYLIVWTAAGLAAYALVELVRSADPAFLAWDAAGRYVTGGVILAAAVYQVTPHKQVCLAECRSPMGFLAERWRAGRPGAVELGVRHGAWCLGCCWALMASLFAVGLMGLGWMALTAAFITAERLLPWPNATRSAVALALLVIGLGVTFTPDAVPGFTEPGGAMHQSGDSMR